MKFEITLRVPVLVAIELEADTQEEAEDHAMEAYDFTAGEVDGVPEIVEAVEVEA